MKRKFCAILFVFCFGCVAQTEIPEDVMSKEQMVGFLIDIQTLEGEATVLKIPRDSSQLLYRYFEDKIKQEHKVTDSLYMRSLKFYYSHPKLMEEIYTAVLDSLSLYERMSEGTDK